MSARFVLRCGTASGFVVAVIVICNTPGIGQAAESGKIPDELWGKWLVVRELNTRAISCWGKSGRQEGLANYHRVFFDYGHLAEIADES